MSKIAANLRAFRIAVNAHDRENPDHSPAHGIGLSAFDMERLGFEEGEELWSGITVSTVNVGAGQFRVLCDGQHDGEREQVEVAEPTRAVGVEARG